ncbi:MAG: response regulator transcription factor [Coriobacteriales bacterium]|jgi:DNA-binding response OmpR family regulator|nr:response regulator transcription factor [Coriobacteriales bacterium]
MRVLLVEDQVPLAEAMAQVLQRNHYTVDMAHDGQYGLDCSLTRIYDIIVLDIMLPLKDGLAVLREMRAAGIDTPVILLTARDSLAERVGGLDLGADDYLPKPFHTAELLARMRALQRRKSSLEVDNTIRVGNTTHDPHALEVSFKDNMQRLSLKESQLLELLLINQGRIMSKGAIIEKIWGFEDYADENRVETYISLLRKKLLQIDSDVEIVTVRGAGYRLCEKLGP